MSPSIKNLPGLMLFAALMACVGCASTADLVRERSVYDASCELRDQAQEETAKKNDFYLEMITHASNPASSPYTDLLAGIDAMEKQIDAMTALSQQIRSFEKKFDNFAKGRKTIESEDAEDWKQLKGLRSEFKPLGEQMQGVMDQYRQTSSDFDLIIQQKHIAKTTAEAVKKDVTDFLEKLDKGVTDMDQIESNDRRNLSNLQNGGGAIIIVTQKQDLLDKMDTLLTPLRNLQGGVHYSGQELLQKLPPEGEIWTGPGMNDTGDPSTDIWSAEATFYQNKQDFYNLAERFDQVTSAPAAAP